MSEVLIEKREEHTSNDKEEVSDSIPQENTSIRMEETYYSIAQESTSTEIEEIFNSSDQENPFEEIEAETCYSSAQENPFNEVGEVSNISEEFTSVEMEGITDSMIKKMLENNALHSSISERCSIYKIPEVFHKTREPSKYRPRAISIGPFHCRDQSLKTNEGFKLHYAHDLLARTARIRVPQGEEELTGSIQLHSSEALITIFKECVTSVKKIETEVRRCYSEPIDLNTGEFVKMMVIDGLFIIELFIQFGLGEDPFEFNLLLGGMVKEDLFLLENQLPLFVLKCLFDQIELPAEIGWLSFMVLIVHPVICCYHMYLVPEGLDHFYRHREECEDAKHLLDLLGMMLQLVSEEETSADPQLVNRIPSAAELNRAGVRFKRGLKNQRFVEIKFTGEGIFEIPPTYFYCGTEAILRNLIACEQLYSVRYNLTSYSHLMDSLINSAEDVAVLREAGIFEIFLGCDEDVSNIFNNLGSEVILKRKSYSNLEKRVHKYYKKRRHIWKATLKREYFNNPWAIISFFAALLLILLTIISTVFGILQVVLPK